MKKVKFILNVSIFLFLSLPVLSQKLWKETDRSYLVNKLIQSRDSIIKETENLGKEQWDFKESPDGWSMKEVVEHIAIWELLLMHEVSKALSGGPQPELNKTAKADSVYLGFILEEKPHISVEYTKPFTYTLPMGLNDGKNNMAWFLKMRNESIEYLKIAQEDLRGYYFKQGRPNVHQVYIYIFGHSERHLRQIKKIKANSNYPRD